MGKNFELNKNYKKGEEIGVKELGVEIKRKKEDQ